MRGKLRIECQKIPDRGRGFGAPPKVAAGRCHYEIGPEESGYVDPIRALEGLLVFLFMKVIPQWSEMHPTRVVNIEFHRAVHDRGTSLELAGVHDLHSQNPERV